ncbi:hypothetical protein [Caulobacter sp. 17J80-11]|uniref:hypothetical protein n=1 Tax=Caulobacter sp. 17J80-11 TaxID=2763502 RepID=UPI0016534351|nr:hypothetical protein [Caulobacter sp. 17J80-11]MBC6982170.1 hypothetical protein [Caulobacter sp. 17J80-11]
MSAFRLPKQKLGPVDPVLVRRNRIMMWARFPVLAAALGAAYLVDSFWPALAALALWYLVWLFWVGGVGRY